MPRRSPTPRRRPAPWNRPPAPTAVAARAAAISAELKARGLKHSSVRDVVLEEFLGAGAHVSIEQLLRRVRARVPGTGYSTVYRTLRILVEHGHATAHDFGGAQALFEPAGGRHHDHLLCLGCGEVREFQDPEIEALQEKAARRLGYRISSHRLELYGLCSSCAAKA